MSYKTSRYHSRPGSYRTFKNGGSLRSSPRHSRLAASNGLTRAVIPVCVLVIAYSFNFNPSRLIVERFFPQIQGAILTGTFGSNQVSTPTTTNSGGSCSGSDSFPGWSCTGTTVVSLHVSVPSSGVTICYTNDSSTPTISGTSCTHGTMYTVGITTTSTTTYKAIAGATGYSPSGVMTVVYTITPAGLSVVGNGANCFSGGSDSCTTSSISVQAGDQLAIFMYNGITGGFSYTITDNQSSHETYTTQTESGNSYIGGWWSRLSTVESIGTTNASFTVTVTATGAVAPPIGVSILQMRGTANATADQTACNDTSGPPATSATVPASGGSSCTTTSVTTNHTGIVVAGFQTALANTFTAGSCFSSTATIPSSVANAGGTIEYLILNSQPLTGTCGITWGGTSGFMGQLATYH